MNESLPEDLLAKLREVMAEGIDDGALRALLEQLIAYDGSRQDEIRSWLDSLDGQMGGGTPTARGAGADRGGGEGQHSVLMELRRMGVAASVHLPDVQAPGSPVVDTGSQEIPRRQEGSRRYHLVGEIARGGI